MIRNGAQRLVAALSAPMRAGTLYEVDLRLRPSGKKGPVAASISAFEEYFRGEADLWEHLALSRARVLCGDAGLRAKTGALLADLVSLPREAATVRHETAAMRSLMAHEKPGKDRYDVKDRAGGLVDGLAAGLLAGRRLSPRLDLVRPVLGDDGPAPEGFAAGDH